MNVKKRKRNTYEALNFFKSNFGYLHDMKNKAYCYLVTIHPGPELKKPSQVSQWLRTFTAVVKLVESRAIRQQLYHDGTFA